MPDQDPVDMMVLIREECKPKCVKAKEILETCYERVRQKESGDCDGYYLDYLSCIDYHSAPRIMKHLK